MFTHSLHIIYQNVPCILLALAIYLRRRKEVKGGNQMSNTIAVKGGFDSRVSYCSFEWRHGVLIAWYKGAWRIVKETGAKNKYGDKIFQVQD